MVIESDIKDRKIKLLEEEKKNLNLKNLEKDTEIERLNRLLMSQGKLDDRYNAGCQEDPGHLITTDCLGYYDFDEENNLDSNSI